MDTSLHFEMHFHTEEDASALVRTEARGPDARFLHVLLFCQLAARQLANLGSHPVSNALAQILVSIGTGGGRYGDYFELVTKLKNDAELGIYLPFIAALGVDISMIIGLMPSIALYRAANKLTKEQIARELCPQIAHVRPHTGSEAKRRFVADLSVSSTEASSFHFEPKGFGFLAQGINYYAPMSVILAFNYLHSPHNGMTSEDIPPWNLLVRAANQCGNAHLQGKFTSLGQATLPMQITKAVLS